MGRKRHATQDSMKHGAHNNSTFRFKGIAYLLVAAIAVVTIGAAATMAFRGESSDNTATMTPTAMGTPQKTVALPTYARSGGTKVQEAYQYAVDRQEILQWVPGYCGCGGHAGHRSNENCFVQAFNADGSIAFDNHGASCDMCVELALDAKKLASQGKSLRDIRNYVQSKYGNLGPATNTPYPPA